MSTTPFANGPIPPADPFKKDAHEDERATEPTTHALQTPQRKMPTVVAAIYVIGGAAWIFLSDHLLALARLSPEQTLRLQTYKGWLFVLISAILIYGMLRWYTRRAAAVMRELRLSEMRTRASEEGYLFALQVTNDAIWDYDATSGGMRWNDGFTRLFGYSENEVKPRLDWLLERIHPADGESLSSQHFDILSLDGFFTRRYRFQRHDGSYAYVVDRGYAFRDGYGALRRVISGMTDVTPLIESEQEIRRINNELEQRVVERTQQLEFANRELEAFAYAVSHDLRAPLRSISGFSQALKETASEALDSKTLHFLQRIQDASLKMSHLIDDLLQLSRISRSEMMPRTIDFTQLCQACAAIVRERYPGRTIHLDIEPGMTIYGDSRLLGIAIDNLLDNAWKYTVHAARAEVSVGQEEIGGERVVFVRDNGVGFNMSYAGKLFAPFQRLHTESQFPGTGIGLCTVQRILMRHGGRVWADAQVNEGATFRFTLPKENLAA